jgi:hypothetical protein
MVGTTLSEKSDVNTTFKWLITSEDFTPYSPIKALNGTPVSYSVNP